MSKMSFPYRRAVLRSIRIPSYEAETARFRKLASNISTEPRFRQKRSPDSVKRKKVQSFDLNTVFSDVFNSLKGSFNKPLVILSLLLVSAVVLTHQDVFESGVIGQWVKNNRQQNTLAKWISENSKKFLGLIIFIPTLFDIPKSLQLMVAMGTVLWVMLVPEYSVFQYVIQSLCLHTFFKVKMSQTRVTLVLLVVLFYFLNFSVGTTSKPPSGGVTD